jgi:AmiR/NasT family two-component response regulator
MPRGFAPSKIDKNQPEIVEALRKAGYTVIDLHALGGGIPDLMVVSKHDNSRVLLIEVKMPKEHLNDKEQIWHAAYPGRATIAHSGAEAVELMNSFETERWKL